MRSGEEVDILLVKDSSSKTGSTGGEKIPQQHNNSRYKFPVLSPSERNKNDAMFMKSVDEFINCCGSTF